MIHLLIPMSGQGTRYAKAGYPMAKPLVPVSGRPMLSRVVECYPTEWPAHFVMAENHKSSELPVLIDQLRPAARVSYVPVHTEGPIRAIEEGLKNIPEDEAVLISYCDFGMRWDAQAFRKFVETSHCDACLISYRGFHAHYLGDTPYAYSRMDGERVVEVREKGCFTEDRETEFASAGAYYFRTARILKQALQFQRDKNLKVNNEFYTSLTVEALLQMKKDAHVRVFEIESFFQWGTPEDLRRFEYWEKTYDSYNANVGKTLAPVDQILMPMAGLGSRFQNLASYPKAFIPINGRPMFLRAIETLPPVASQTVFVGLKKHSALLNKFKPPRSKVVSLESTPAGQALTTDVGVSQTTGDKEIIVSSCDHGIVIDEKVWNGFAARPDCDAAIFTVRGFPGASVRPEAFAYVEPANDELFPLVKSVSVKKPLSQAPERDHLLVGTFWFAKSNLLKSHLQSLIAADVRVNKELYLDSIFNLMIDAGLRVRIIPLSGYINWGDPDSLAEALYWYEVFCRRRLERRPRFPGIDEKWVLNDEADKSTSPTFGEQL